MDVRRRGGQARLVDPLMHTQGIHQIRIVIQEVLLYVFDSLSGRDALECEMPKIAFQKLIKTLTAEDVFQSLEKECTLLVRDQRRPGIRVAPFQIDVQDL